MPKHVLIVDDDPEIVRATQLRLRAAGYATAAAFDGEQALRAVATHRPDVIVLDVQMPVKDGLTALTELKRAADTKDIPVVMLSASIIDEQSALECGARYFLRKPCEHRHLTEALQTILGS